jgi:hypothetical protein
METQLVIPRSQEPSTITELLEALRKADFKPSHERKRSRTTRLSATSSGFSVLPEPIGSITAGR